MLQLNIKTGEINIEFFGTRQSPSQRKTGLRNRQVEEIEGTNVVFDYERDASFC